MYLTVCGIYTQSIYDHCKIYKSDNQQEISEIHTPNNEFRNFVAAHFEAATEFIADSLKV